MKIDEVKRKGDSFTCENCHETFDHRPDNEWSEQDAIEEFKKDFPDCQNDDIGIICDDCHVQIKKWVDSLTSEEKINMREKYEREKTGNSIR